MVKVRTTLSVVVDTARVVREGEVVRLDAHCEWLLVQCGHHLVLVRVCHGSERADSDARGGCGVVLAGMGRVPRTRDVLVDGLIFCQEAVLVVLVGVVLESTVAALVTVRLVGTIDELLLREGEQVTSCHPVGALKRTRRREGPA